MDTSDRLKRGLCGLESRFKTAVLRSQDDVQAGAAGIPVLASCSCVTLSEERVKKVYRLLRQRSRGLRLTVIAKRCGTPARLSDAF